MNVATQSLEAQQSRALALLILMRDYRGLTAGEIQGTLGLTQATADAVLAELVRQGLVTSITGLFSREKRYVLSREGLKLIDRASSRVDSFITEPNKETAE